MDATERLSPDVIVADIAMPGIDGISATTLIRRNDPHARIVLVTVHSESMLVEAGLAAGALGYVLKDTAGDELVPVHAALAGRQYVSRELGVGTHAGMTTDEFERIGKEWFATAKHPRFNRPYTDMPFRPMVEVVGHLRANKFKTYIVSGGGVEFMRVIAEQLYGIPPAQVIGSSGKLRYEVRDGAPVIVRLPELDFFDDKEGKPAAIQKFIGQRPIAAFGNSDGDLQMLQL